MVRRTPRRALHSPDRRTVGRGAAPEAFQSGSLLGRSLGDRRRRGWSYLTLGLERASYLRPPPFDASERAARPPRSGNSRCGAESTSSLGPRFPSACSGSSSSAHRSRRTCARRPEHPSDRQRGLSAGCRQRSCAGLPREQGWDPLTGICRYRDLLVNFGIQIHISDSLPWTDGLTTGMEHSPTPALAPRGPRGGHGEARAG